MYKNSELAKLQSSKISEQKICCHNDKQTLASFTHKLGNIMKQGQRSEGHAVY